MKCLLPLLLVACGGAEPCVSACGAFYSNVFSCEAADRAEDATICLYAKHAGYKVGAMCSALRGWAIDVTELDNPVLTHNGASGITLMPDKVVLVAKFPAPQHTWHASSYTHELGHVFDIQIDYSKFREKPLDCLEQDKNTCNASHNYWLTRHFWDAIHEGNNIREEL